MKRRRSLALAVTVASAAALTCAGSAQAAAQPDLVVTAVGWTPANPVAGQPVTFTATVRNQGTAPTPAGVVHGVGFQVDGVLRTWSDNSTASLAPGASVTLKAVGGPAGSTWNAVQGRRSITAHVDDAKRMAESNENNNLFSRPLDVAAAPAAPALSSRVRMVNGSSVAVASTAGAHPVLTGLASSLKGSVHAGCLKPPASPEPGTPGTLVQGTERFLFDTTVGSEGYTPGAGSWGTDGLVTVPANAAPTQVVSKGISFFGPIARWNYGALDTITCPAGSSAAFTRFQAKSLTTKRFVITGEWTSGGALVSSTTVPVDFDAAGV
ncbi:hypothetical protein NUM3379_32580 [Kineococcus sp. NUM-3379]